jgi:hypothetical protein
MKLRETLLLAAIMVGLALPALAGDLASTPSASDLKALKKIMEDESVTYVRTLPKGMTLSGYVDTSYTKRFTPSGQIPVQTAAVTSGTLTTEKLSIDMPLPDKNDWAVGFRVDALHNSDTK